jgi:hypothetical protein
MRSARSTDVESSLSQHGNYIWCRGRVRGISFRLHQCTCVVSVRDLLNPVTDNLPWTSRHHFAWARDPWQVIRVVYVFLNFLKQRSLFYFAKQTTFETKDHRSWRSKRANKRTNKTTPSGDGHHSIGCRDELAYQKGD